jgi:transposase InsO family protein
MPFGLTGAPGTFQEAMNSTLAPLLRKFVLVFFDDILIYSRTFEEHLDHLQQVFELLQLHEWKLKLSKCAFAQRSISYLGHIISGAGVATDPDKLAAVTNWPSPVSVRELRGFLGLAGYYRKFVRHFGLIAKPLTELLRKNTVFQWTPDHESSFQALKQSLVTAPVLALPDYSRPFCIETDASSIGIGAVLTQDGHPLAYISRALGPKSKGLSTYEKEYMAVILAVQQWRQYLQFAEFTIYTDQQSLVQLTDQRLHTPWQQKLFTKLLGLQYRIVYKSGSSNGAADALSRRTDTVDSCAAISMVTPQWIQQVVDGYAHDADTQSLIAKLMIDPLAVHHFSLRAGVLRYQDRIWIGSNPDLQRKLLSACHSSALGGHSGFPATYTKMKQLFAWKGMRQAVRDYVASCLTCQRAKPDRSRLPGLLQPLPVPSGAWQILSMDFVEGLPRSKHVNCILVIIDSFTKYAHFLALSHPFTAASVAKLFLDHVYRLHGMPVAIISDRDRIFTSHFWQELFKLADVQLQMSSSYHPQSDGQTERLNQSMDTFLRCFANACPSKWSSWLPLAEFWYNSSPHSALGRSPFEALYGFPPRHFGISALDSVSVPELSTWLTDRATISDLLQQHLARAKERMKRQADKNRTERTFQVGDWVLVKLQPYVQTTLAPRSNQKLAFKYFGPFQITARVGTVAYTLDLPSSSAVHPTFHVSQLKKAVLPGTLVSSLFPTDIELPRVPIAILQRRQAPTTAGMGEQVLVQWSGWPPELATWEFLETVRQQYPRAPAWGQAGSQAPGTVSTATTAGPTDAKDKGPRRSGRSRRPNTMVVGKEWA